VDKVLNLSKDCAFETVVTSAEFDKDAGNWTIKTADGRTAKAKYLVVAAGFAAKRCKNAEPYAHIPLLMLHARYPRCARS
jgi:cation diffusion facilitator CzcD-associated flavoprotein CzcO